jgi:hypothetical protein
MSLKDTSIEARSIINWLAATKSFSAVALRPLGSLLGALVFKGGGIRRRQTGFADAHKPKPRRTSRVN